MFGDEENAKWAEYSSWISGIIFGIGWWIFFDAAVWCSSEDTCENLNFEYYMPGIIASIGLFLVNSVPAEHLDSNNAYAALGASGNTTCGKLMFFLGFLCLFGAGMTGSVAVYAMKFAGKDNSYVGLTMIFQAAFIIIAACVLRWMRSNPCGD